MVRLTLAATRGRQQTSDVSVAETQQAMQRYFETLGTDQFPQALDPSVTWTVTDTSEVISGPYEVGQHLDALHAAMAETRTRDLVFSEDMAYLEGDCAAPDESGRRLAFCVAYETRSGRVCAMRLYGRLEAALAHHVAQASQR